MQAVANAPNLIGRRLTGAVLHALLLAGVILPMLFGGLPWLRGSALLLAMSAVIVPIALYDLVCWRRPDYVQFWAHEGWRFIGITPQLFDDALTSRQKLMATLKTGWGVAWLAIVLLWLGYPVIDLLL